MLMLLPIFFFSASFRRMAKEEAFYAFRSKGIYAERYLCARRLRTHDPQRKKVYTLAVKMLPAVLKQYRSSAVAQQAAQAAARAAKADLIPLGADARRMAPPMPTAETAAPRRAQVERPVPAPLLVCDGPTSPPCRLAIRRYGVLS